MVVSGPSGVGKGTLLGLLLSRRPDCVFSISATTRAPRPGEFDGIHYYFLTEDIFESWVEQGRFLEWNKVFNRFYGTPREFVEQQLSESKNVVMDLDVQGGVQVIQTVPDAVSIFIAPPDLETLRKRLTQRGTETEEQIRTRLLTARGEMKHMSAYRYIIVNDDLEKAEATLEAILTAEQCRTDRQVGSFPRLI